MDKDTLLKKYKNMKQFKDLSEEELEQLINKKIQEEELLTSFVGIKEEKKQKALQLYNQYVTEHSFESLAEKSTLINLVYLEMLNDQIKEYIEKEDKEKLGAIPLKMTEQLIENTNQIMELKEKLGMLKDKANDSIYQLWKDLEEKCLKYYEEHAAEFQNKCPYCNKLFPSILPPEKLTPQVSSWFKGTDLYNEEVFNLYHNKIISEEQAAKILGVSNFYIPYIYQEIYLKEKNDK